MKYGYALPKRVELITKLVKRKGKYKQPLKFQGDLQLFDVHKVSIDMPKYRLANGRTQAAQEEYLEKHSELEDNYFECDPEVERKQEIQHGILKSMLHDKGINLIDFFEDEKQDEPLILDCNGFVINGNRRLCAMRELYYGDTEEYKRFSHIDVIILPPCDEEDIDELEATLQIVKDIKAEYTWVAKACMLRKRQEYYEYTDDQLAKLYGIESSEVRKLLDILGYGEQYLESRGIPKQYSKIEDKEYAFEQIRKGRTAYTSRDEVEKGIFQNLSFMLIDSPDEAGLGRVYAAIGNVAKYLDQIQEELKSELPVENYQYNDEFSSQIDLFGEADEEEEKRKELGKLSVAIEDESNREKIITTIREVIERQKNLEDEKNKENFVVRQLKKANTALTDALNSFDDKTNKEGVDTQLDTICELINKIREKVNEC